MAITITEHCMQCPVEIEYIHNDGVAWTWVPQQRVAGLCEGACNAPGALIIPNFGGHVDML